MPVDELQFRAHSGKPMRRMRRFEGVAKTLSLALFLATAAVYGTSAHAQAGCENPPVDEPDGDGDECYFPPDPKKSLGSMCSGDTNEIDAPGLSCGNPIHLATGNKVQVETDYVGFGPLPLRLTRTYNSQADNLAGPFGPKWTFSYGASIVWPAAQPQTAYIVRSDGKTFTLRFVNNQWTQDSDINSRLVALYSGPVLTGWDLLRGDDGVDSFDVSGRLVTTRDRAGVTHTLTYDGSGNLWKVTDTAGRALVFTFDANKRVTAVSTPGGRQLSYQYDAIGNLKSVGYPDGTVKLYLYEIPALPNALTGIIDQRGIRYATWRYDAAGIAIASEHAGGVDKVTINYDFNNGYHKVTDALGNVTNYSQFTLQGTARSGFVNSPLMDGAASGDGGFSDQRIYDDNGNLKSHLGFRDGTGLKHWPPYIIYTYGDRNLESSRTYYDRLYAISCGT